MTIPSLILFKGGEEVARVIGAKPEGRDPARHRAAPELRDRRLPLRADAERRLDVCASSASATRARGPRHPATPARARRASSTPQSSTGASARRPKRPSAPSRMRGSLRVDGLVGPDTWGQLVEAGYRLGDRTLYLHSPMFRGDDVRDLPAEAERPRVRRGKEDGFYGRTPTAPSGSSNATSARSPTASSGPHTIATLERMRPQESAPSRALVREEEELRGCAARSRDA